MPRTEPIPGKRAVQEALRSARHADRLLVSSKVTKDDVLDDILDLAKRLSIPVEIANETRLTRTARTKRHQGVVLVAHARETLTVQDLLDIAERRDEDPFLVCVDGVEDPQNLGAIARSALLAGAHGIVVPRRGTARVGPGAMRASAGAFSIIGVAQVSSMPSALGSLNREHIWLVGADAYEGKAVWQTRMTGPVALVLGSEHEGLSPAVKKILDGLVHIPTPGGDLSMNVSAAAAVLCFERVRQQHQGPP